MENFINVPPSDRIYETKYFFVLNDMYPVSPRQAMVACRGVPAANHAETVYENGIWMQHIENLILYCVFELMVFTFPQTGERRPDAIWPDRGL